jgi:hypothetical protein
MVTSVQPQALSSALRFNPDWFTDPAPPWVLDHLTPAVIRQLAVIQLESTIAIHQVRIDAAKKAIEIVSRVK